MHKDMLKLSPFMHIEHPRNEHCTASSEALQNRLESGVLADIQAYPHFVVWKYTTVEGKVKKPPYNPKTGYVASPTNPDTWGSMQQALTALRTGKYDGVGFVFSPDDPFTGTDLDHCMQPDGTLEHWASEIVTALDSYTEYSPSKSGLHILTKATLPGAGRKRGNLEMYSHGRYFTLTTNHVAGTPLTIADRQREQETLYRAYEPLTHETREHSVFERTRDDATLLQKVMGEKHDALFIQLYKGDTAGFPSKSNADFTFVLKLLYWTGDDKEQTRRLFLQSQLVDQKTLSPRGDSTYLDVTIENALKKRQQRS